MSKIRLIGLSIVIIVAFLISACGNTKTPNEGNEDTNNLSEENKHNNMNNENNSNTSNEKNNDKKNTAETVPVQEYSEEEKKAASQEFLDWAIPQAEKGGMAVTDNYFGHGASGSGDWYAVTEDGEIQVQEQDPTKELPGYDAYDIHALGGVVFYTSLSGVTGLDETSYEHQGGAGGGRKYTEVAEPDEPLHKYLLGDNGVVYELIGNAEELDNYQTGFGLYDDDGKDKLFEEKYTFEVSDDQNAQQEWVKILEKYQ